MNTRIKELRKAKKLSQAAFGEKIGLSQRAISDIENGTNALSERNFNAICQTFNVNPEWLRHGTGEMFLKAREVLIQEVAAEFDFKDEEILLLRMFLDLTHEQRQGVLSWVKDFAKTLALRMGIDYPARDEVTPVKPDSELTRDEKHTKLDKELDAVDGAKKEATTTSSVFTGSSGVSKKSGRSP